ncbi:hypothetical protein ACX40Y_15840 [Sphingomonas sp. RS6]
MRLDERDMRQTGFGPGVTVMIAISALIVIAVTILWRLNLIAG